MSKIVQKRVHAENWPSVQKRVIHGFQYTNNEYVGLLIENIIRNILHLLTKISKKEKEKPCKKGCKKGPSMNMFQILSRFLKSSAFGGNLGALAVDGFDESLLVLLEESVALVDDKEAHALQPQRARTDKVFQTPRGTHHDIHPFFNNLFLISVVSV